MLDSIFLRGARAARRLRDEAGFTDGALTHELLIPTEAGGRPGECVMAPSKPLHPLRIGDDGTRHDFQVLADGHGSVLSALCLRRIASPYDVEESAWSLLSKWLRDGVEGSYELVEDRIAGDIAYRYSVVLGVGHLTEWKFAHAGWLYVLGLINRAPTLEAGATAQRTLAVLETWKWLPTAAAGVDVD